MYFVQLLAMLLANALTAFRCIAGVTIPVALYLEFNPLWIIWETRYQVGVFSLAILAAFSDTLDGAIAKRFGGETWFGKNFDPSADALLCVGITAAILINGGVSWYAFTFYWMPATAAIIYTARVIRMRWKDQIHRPNPEARIGIGCFMFAGIVLLGRIAFDGDRHLEAAGIASIIFGLYLQYHSLSEYQREVEKSS